eukprot:TRINITY_DN37527_c0_g1_i1.p2 TRINITY_DN37527_c0_g1~~TRINITY_DN37527_c0_g1_i1.p2  ORF type:complete len:115 (+),score=10.70 TRINITY_DN37527_c0_g1_i1:197-541(+)
MPLSSCIQTSPCVATSGPSPLAPVRSCHVAFPDHLKARKIPCMTVIHNLLECSTIFCGAPSSLMFLISGILCLTGPTLGIIISNTITSIFHLVILILAIIFACYEDVYLCNCVV